MAVQFPANQSLTLPTTDAPMQIDFDCDLFPNRCRLKVIGNVSRIVELAEFIVVATCNRIWKIYRISKSKDRVVNQSRHMTHSPTYFCQSWLATITNQCAQRTWMCRWFQFHWSGAGKNWFYFHLHDCICKKWIEIMEIALAVRSLLTMRHLRHKFISYLFWIFPLCLWVCCDGRSRSVRSPDNNNCNYGFRRRHSHKDAEKHLHIVK